MNEDRLEALLNSKNCRDICPDAVRRIYEGELAKRRDAKEADKAARTAIHQMTGAFMTPQQLKKASSLLEEYAGGREEALAEALSLHASTRERLACADELYARIFEITGTPVSILDLACGLNPLWLGSKGYSVVGLDVHGGAVNLVNAFAARMGWNIQARCADLLSGTPKEQTDVCLMMKLLPVLEQQRKGSAIGLLCAVRTPWRVVTFPTRTLGGRGVGMQSHYSQWMEENLPPSLCVAGRFLVDNELCYVLKEA